MNPHCPAEKATYGRVEHPFLWKVPTFRRLMFFGGPQTWHTNIFAQQRRYAYMHLLAPTWASPLSTSFSQISENAQARASEQRLLQTEGSIMQHHSR